MTPTTDARPVFTFHGRSSAALAPLLSRERELELTRRWRDHHDRLALTEIVEAFERLVLSNARRYQNYGLPLADLVQEGHVGLLQAAARFEPERGLRFATYAIWWVRAAIQDFILRNWSMVRTGTTAAQKSLFFNLRRLRAQLDPTADRLSPENQIAVSRRLGVPIAEVVDMEARLGAADQSLNRPLDQNGDEEWQDLLACSRPTPEEDVGRRFDAEIRTGWLKEALGELSQRERMIIERRRLREEEVTLEMLGRELGVSKERVRQIEERALHKLRQSLRHRVTRAEA